MKKAFPWLVLAHVLVFILFWLTNSLFYRTVNDFLADVVGLNQDFVSIFIIFSAAIGLWSAARLFLAWRGKSSGRGWIFGLGPAQALVAAFGAQECFDQLDKKKGQP